MSIIEAVEVTPKVQQMLDLYRNGYSYLKIGKKLRLHKDTVRGYVVPHLTDEIKAEHRLSYKGNISKLSDFNVDEALRLMLEEGMNLTDLARHYRVSRRSIQIYMQPHLTPELRERIRQRSHGVSAQRRKKRRKGS